MANANFDHAPIASDLDLFVEEGAHEEAQQGARHKYGKALLVAALVLSSFACGAAFAKNVSAVPARSSGDRAVGLMNTFEFASDLSAYTTGKSPAQVAAAYDELADNKNEDPVLSATAAWLATQPAAVKKALYGSLEASAMAEVAKGEASVSQFGPLNTAYAASLTTAPPLPPAPAAPAAPQPYQEEQAPYHEQQAGSAPAEEVVSPPAEEVVSPPAEEVVSR